MNQFQNTQSGAGILKNDYGQSPVDLVLKKRMEKLTKEQAIKNEMARGEPISDAKKARLDSDAGMGA